MFKKLDLYKYFFKKGVHIKQTFIKLNIYIYIYIYIYIDKMMNYQKNIMKFRKKQLKVVQNQIVKYRMCLVFIFFDDSDKEKLLYLKHFE